MEPRRSQWWRSCLPDHPVWFWSGFLSGYAFIFAIAFGFSSLLFLVCETDWDLYASLQLCITPLPFALISALFCMCLGCLLRKVQTHSEWKWLWASFLCSLSGPVVATSLESFFSGNRRWLGLIIDNFSDLALPCGFGLCFWLVMITTLLIGKAFEKMISTTLNNSTEFAAC